MKVIECKDNRAKATPKRRRIFDSTQLFGKGSMKEAKKHPLGELLRDELVLRFLGRNLNASPTELLEICNSFLQDFSGYPEDVLTSAIKDMREFSPDDIANTHIYNFIKKRIADQIGGTDINDLVWHAGVSRELKDGKKYHPMIENLVDGLPDHKVRMIKEHVSHLPNTRTVNHEIREF